MLCSLKTKRPDKLLQKRLIMLAYSIITLTLSLVFFFLYPEHVIYSIFIMLFLTALCLHLTIKAISAGEEAMSYGGFANEILKDSFKIKRIDNADLEPILQNIKSQDFFKNENILKFLEKNLFDNRSNKQTLKELKNACSNLREISVNLSLDLNQQEEWFEIYMRPIFLKKAEIFEEPFSVKTIKKDAYVYWCIKETTAIRNMEQIFVEEKKSLHDFLDYLPVGLYICNRDYDIEYVNHAFAKTLGHSREWLCKNNLKDLLSSTSEKLPKTEDWSGNLYLIGKNKEIIECFCSQENFRQNQEIKTRGVMISNLPTDEQLKSDLNRALDKVSWLFDTSPVSTLFIDKSGDIINCNSASLKFFDSPKDHLLSKNIFEYIVAEDYQNTKDSFRTLFAGHNLSSPLDVKIKHGKEEKMAVIFSSPMKNFHTADAEQINGLVLYLLDTTEQKNLEIKFAQAQKMQAMGQLAGGVAHDFNNLLTAMIGFCDLLLQRHGIGDPSFADLIQIKQNANRAAGLVRQLLAFSRKQPLQPKLIDVSENFVELSHMLKRILGEQIILKFHHGSDLGFAKVDPVQFSQVIINLAVNAKDAMDNHGTLTIATRVERLNDPYQFGPDTIKPGDFIAIDVKDTGCGISSENLSRIFEPFFSTKQNIVGSGTGLGLATVYGIVRQTEGFIKVQTSLGSGTTFSIYLPRFESSENTEQLDISKDSVTSKDQGEILKVQEKDQKTMSFDKKLILGLNLSSIDRAENQPGNGARILFVEDEDSVRSFAVRALQKKGFDVVACSCAENALSQIKDDKNFQLLITDMMMPGINGAELAKIIKSDIKDIKIILASGYSEEIAKNELANDSELEFMAKPFSLGDLTKKVFDILKK